MTDPSRNAPPWVTWLLVLLGFVFAAVAVVYLAQPAADLPSFFPGHDTALHSKHIKHGIGMLGLTALAWAGAWLTTGTRTQPPGPSIDS